MLVVVGHDLRLRSSLRLLTPQAGDPGVVAAQRAGERARFPDLAAEAAELDRLIERVGSVLPGEGAHLGRIRRHDLDRDAVAIAHRVDHVMRLLGQPAGVQRDHMHRTPYARRHVDEHRRLHLKAGHDREPGKRGLRPSEHRLRILP